MSDYIKREDALKAVNGIHEDDLPRNNKIEVCDVLTLVVPSADVAPVRHGRWIEDRNRTEEIYTNPVKCSACGQTNVLEFGTLTAYCPNCGAKMDGDAND